MYKYKKKLKEKQSRKVVFIVYKIGTRFEKKTFYSFRLLAVATTLFLAFKFSHRENIGSLSE